MLEINGVEEKSVQKRDRGSRYRKERDSVVCISVRQNTRYKIVNERKRKNVCW